MMVCAGASAQSTEEIWDAINSYRVEYGLPKLARVPALDLYCAWYLGFALDAEGLSHTLATETAKGTVLWTYCHKLGLGVYRELLAESKIKMPARMLVSFWDFSPAHHSALFDWTGASVAGLASARNSRGVLKVVLLLGGN